jgi:hypothetical protein
MAFTQTDANWHPNIAFYWAYDRFYVTICVDYSFFAEFLQKKKKTTLATTAM